jgi:hypothetical protein
MGMRPALRLDGKVEWRVPRPPAKLDGAGGAAHSFGITKLLGYE